MFKNKDNHEMLYGALDLPKLKHTNMFIHYVQYKNEAKGDISQNIEKKQYTVTLL